MNKFNINISYSTFILIMGVFFGKFNFLNSVVYILYLSNFAINTLNT